MRSYLSAFLVALVVVVLLTPLFRRLALRVGAVSLPGGRHIHGRAMPRLGGLAIVGAVSAPVLALMWVDSEVARNIQKQIPLALGLLLGGAFVCGIGAVDDIRGLRASVKLAGQVAAASAAFACGYRIDAVHVPFLGALEMGAFGYPVTVLWIVAVTNAVNLIDGLDGLAAGVLFLAAATSLAVAVVGGNIFVSVVMASMMGALLGFLFFNFNPARIFLGDSGSYFLGFVFATTAMAGATQKATTAVALAGPILALGLPFFDTLLSILRRVVERRPIFSADRGHIHHRLLDLGLTHRRAVLLLYGVSFLFAGTALALTLGRTWERGIALVSALALVVWLIKFSGYMAGLRRPNSAAAGDSVTFPLLDHLPELIRRIGNARTERDVWTSLKQFASKVQLLELTVRAAGVPARRWSNAPDPVIGKVLPFVIGDSGEHVVEVMLESRVESVSAETRALLTLFARSAVEAFLRVATPEPAPQTLPAAHVEPAHRTG